jgi:hypothetical protein
MNGGCIVIAVDQAMQRGNLYGTGQVQDGEQKKERSPEGWGRPA